MSSSGFSLFKRVILSFEALGTHIDFSSLAMKGEIFLYMVVSSTVKIFY